MVDITPIIPKGRQLITGYGAGGFVINHARVEGSVLVFTDQTIAWAVTDPAQINVEALVAFFVDANIELLLLGTGKQMTLAPLMLRAALKEKHIAVEAMDTGAACRTYNVLLAEERRVAAALIAV